MHFSTIDNLAMLFKIYSKNCSHVSQISVYYVISCSFFFCVCVCGIVVGVVLCVERHTTYMRSYSRTLCVFLYHFLPVALRQGLSLNRKLVFIFRDIM